MRPRTLYVILIALALACTGSAALLAETSDAAAVHYKIGDTGPAGGIIFYDKGSTSNGWRYLESAPTDQTESIRWNNGAYLAIMSAQIGDIGTGKANTAAIIAAQGSGIYAASLCANLELGGYKDWFLPSHDELNRLYLTLKLKGITSLNGKGYWTSSQYREYSAWYQNFDTSTQFGYDTSKTLSVRAIRAF